MARQHPNMKRVYDAALKHEVIKGKNQLTELAEVLALTPQRIKNWDDRGPSVDGMLLIQEQTGINATWVSTGKGPQMVAGWPVGREEVAASKKEAARGTSLAAPVIANVFSQLSRILAAVSPLRRYRMAEMLHALAIAPDSNTLLESIKADLADIGTTAADVPVQTLGTDTSKAWRMQAIRLAEAHPDAKAVALLTEFIGKLDHVMREPAGPKPAPPALSRGGRVKG